MGTLLAFLLAHAASISGVLNGLLTIIGGASVVVAAVPAPKNVGTVLDTAHSVLSVAAMDFSKFTKPTPNGANGDK